MAIRHREPRRVEPEPRDWRSLESRIIECESSGNPTAYNRSSGASGLYQFLKSTWAGHGGYAEARFAPVEVQREKFRILFQASGLKPWYSSRGCWA